jgi:hypothetical protein
VGGRRARPTAEKDTSRSGGESNGPEAELTARTRHVSRQISSAQLSSAHLHASARVDSLALQEGRPCSLLLPNGVFDEAEASALS